MKQLQLFVGVTRIARMRIAAAHALVWVAAKLVRNLPIKAEVK